MAKRVDLSKTDEVERALDQRIGASEDAGGQSERFEALLAQFDRIADRPTTYDPLQWDERGLPLLYKGTDFSETDIASAAPR